jgi:site-specific DNA-cytosine methylase
MSDTQRYKQCGNAVTVDVVQAVAQKVKRLMK